MHSKRLPISLDGDDLAAIAVFSDPDRVESRVLHEWTTQHRITVRGNSEAGIVRALLRAGAESLREKALDAAYAELAKDQSDGTDQQRARRKRYADTVDRIYE
ncbi:hypothetical protein [Rhodococcus sp. 14-2470-1a]|uniref:hypothetical protein n=1 Tax=Rhodococcus sp. 14-2470-1a TaxID=2023150 RepID=UPI000B9C7398|nr:hypothetical protein [Rhodococcus sp. 14-2470-1a]OZF42063.1 hypothetical protein CH292_26585 [Rhodococcus sp. 14-2470-1a]